MKCAYCGANGDTALARDHVVPRSRGGPDNAFNIVMACNPCNSAKRDATAIEWLGDRCPDDVRVIEDRVNARLKRDFQKRDVHARRREPQKLFAFTLVESGKLGYLGEVVNEQPETIRLEVADILLLWAGFWQLSGRLVDVPRATCQLFNDLECCVHAAERFAE